MNVVHLVLKYKMMICMWLGTASAIISRINCYTIRAKQPQDRFARTETSQTDAPPLAQPGLYRRDRRHHPCGAQPLRYQESHRHPRLQGKATLRTRKRI